MSSTIKWWSTLNRSVEVSHREKNEFGESGGEEQRLGKQDPSMCKSWEEWS